MSEATNTPAATPAKQQTVIDDMDQRRVFPTADEALAYYAKCSTEFADFAGYPAAIAGLDEDGNLDPAVYNDSMHVGVSVLTKRGEGKESGSTVHAIVVYPVPTVESILADNNGADWLTGLIHKEINHIAVRQLRKTSDKDGPLEDAIAEAVDSMPTSLADYVTSGREVSAGILETFNKLWQIVKKGIGMKSKPFALANLSKKELRKAMESASYAATVYPQLETRLNKAGEKDSLFVRAATFGVVLAKEESLDPTIFEKMLTGRDEREIEVAEDDDDFDPVAMASKLLKKPDAPTADDSQADEADEASE